MESSVFLAAKSIRFHYCLFMSGLALVLICASYLRTRYFHLNKIRGPPLAAWSRLWLMNTLASGDSADVFVQVNNKYGSLARIGPNLLLTSDAELWRKILGVRSNYERGPWFDCLRIDPHRANLIAERNVEKHNDLRYIMARGYEGKDIDGFMSTIDENLSDWITYINENALDQKFDMARSIQWLDFELICRLCLGHPVGFISEHRDQYCFQQTMEERLPIVERLGVLGEVGTLLKVISYVPILRNVLPSAEDRSGVGKILGLARRAVDQRYSLDYTPKNDIVDSWLSRGVTRKQVETEIVIALFAGSDTTATTLRAMMLYIISNPVVYGKLVLEIQVAEAAGLISHIVTNDEARQMPYLQACIKETIRIFPPIAGLRERLTPPEGDVIHGYTIPGGVQIGVNLRGMLADPNVFGVDSNIFRPERWLEGSPEQLRKMERVHELAFNWGFTRCLGINLANAMMNKFAVECFRRWDITIENPFRPLESRCHGVFFQKNFFVRIKPRAVS